MDGPGSRLASRFRKAIQDQQSAREAAEQSASRAREVATAARARVLADLAAVARDIGFLRVVEADGGVTLRFGERFLRFVPEGDADAVRVEVEGAGNEEHRLYRQAELGDRWVYLRRRRGREDRLPLFDQGLEELLVVGLGMPKPSDTALAHPDGAKKL